MLRFSLFLLLFPLFVTAEVNTAQETLSFSQEGNATQQISKIYKKEKRVFENAMRDFRYGSYYRALDEFTYLTKFPQSPYYLQSLFMVAHTYLYIGKRIGDKKYLWSAINYLNTYLAKGGKKDSEYYYLKGNIYENLGFYERAFSNYKIAFKQATTKKEKLNILMGLLRTAVWLKRMDLATKYMLILTIENLEKKQKKEFAFLQGMYYFAKGEYGKALEFFKKTYRDFESYLIDNPSYYYYVAENAYRYGDLKFAELLFRRILNYVKNKEVLQKALLRLGDIKFLQKDYKSSINYYIRLIKSFPQTSMATVARLKLLYIIQQDKKSAYYIKKYFPDEEFLQDPLRFIVKTLVKYRNSYIGLFALANFGLEAFSLDSQKLYKRLSWELSLVSAKQLKYEHKEYFARLWQEYIDTKHSHALCMLYSANPEFFKAIFNLQTLLRIASFLHGCKKESLRIALLEYLSKRYNTQEVFYAYLEALYQNRMFDKALEVLQKSKVHSYKFYKLYAKICFIAQKECPGVYEKTVALCPKSDLYRNIFAKIVLLRTNKVDTTFLHDQSLLLAKNYEHDEVVQKFVQLFAKKLLDKEQYEKLIDLLGPLAKQIQKDCFLNGVLSLSYVRIGKIEYAKKLVESAKDCNTTWNILAKLAIEDMLLQAAVKE
ncbi:hypothetical protein NitYY0826_C0722 [Nitratiruptor sp. YY08-26]|uniref:tetratricopeptide repeat protein n=1 Tax=unclassified Nitratiruptor TaxID=2624044 RepID=UPI0019162CD0|nr:MULTISPECIES: hypothetical protein [unclassified Nitratiruptor]BCD61859.1 hypothetical protein NitYY0813_C0720 [Nitratiruptor sp. YY08-13]BCD65794.1 hypothetical protein NitYY0826_C0722 [Nitratiruptor sp. YY08-26]